MASSLDPDLAAGATLLTESPTLTMIVTRVRNTSVGRFQARNIYGAWQQNWRAGPGVDCGKGEVTEIRSVAPPGRRKRLRHSQAVVIAAAVLIVAALSGSSAIDAATVTPGFTDTVVFSGLTSPTAVRFAPDGKIFVAEKGGKIKYFDNLADSTPTTFADLSKQVHDFWDRGLLGLALDPAWPAKQNIYALYTYDSAIGGASPRWNDGCPTPPGPTTDGCVASGRLSVLSAGADYRAQVLGDGPVGYWRLGETGGTSAADETGANPGTYQAGPTLGVGGALASNSNTAASFNGSNQYVDVPSSASLNLTSAVTVEAWAKPAVMPGVGNTGTLAMKATDPPYSYWLQVTDNDRAKFGVGVGGVNRPISAGGVVAPGSWYHLVGTYDGTTERLYVNGALVASQPLTGALGTVAGNFRIGTTRSSEWFNGAIDEVAVYNKALTPAQVQAHYIAGAQAVTEKVLIEDWCAQYPSHTIGDLKFGPDGALYASGGDGASFDFADYGQGGGGSGSPTPKNPCGDPPAGVGGSETPPTAEGGSLRSQDLRSTSDPTTLDGAVLRLDPATGAAAAGNPLGSSADANARRIIAHGFRNPFRFTFRPGTNELWIGDVGSGTWEEIDRDSSPSAVSNYGWPCYEGPPRSVEFDSLNLNLCESLYTAPAGTVTSPYFAYRHDSAVVAGDNCPVGGSSLSAVSFYTGTVFPSIYQGALFFGDATRQCIWVMMPGADGLPDPANVRVVVTGAPAVDIELGPDGLLYWADVYNGKIHQLRANNNNTPPVANAVATSPTTGAVPLSVTFDGTGSSDVDGDPLTYAWDLDGDGQYDDSSVAKPSFTYTVGGTYNVRLKVSDPSGGSSFSQPIAVTANNTPPAAAIDAPLATQTWSVGQVINFSGSATDAEDNPVAASGYTWSLILHHCWQYDPTNCHTHTIQTFSGPSGSFAAPDHEYPAFLELQLTVTDSGGLTDTESVRLDPETVQVRFESVPAGLQIVAGSSSQATPFTRTLIKNAVTSISATTPQSVGGTTYNFGSWSDGGAQSHNVTITGPTTYSASYSGTATTSTTAFPTGVVFDSGGLLSGSFASLAADDNSYLSVKPAANRITSWYGRFTGTPKTLSQLRVTYSGGSSVPCAQTVSIYRFTTASWVQLDSRTVANEVLIADLAPPGAASDYVSGGELRVQVRCRADTKSYALNADLLKISFVN
jgi:glucose/arabinose dehydrogenase